MRSWAKSCGGIQSAVRHSSTASSKRPRFDCISMRLVDLVGLILLGGWKEVSERCFVGKMALHQTENTFYTVVCQHLSSLSPSFKSHHLHFAECCQEFGAGIEPTPEKLYEPGSPGDFVFFPWVFWLCHWLQMFQVFIENMMTFVDPKPGWPWWDGSLIWILWIHMLNVYLVASWLWLWPILVGGLEHECYFSILIGNNNPNWLIFFRGVAPSSIFAWLSGSVAAGMRVAGWLPPTWAQRWIRQTATPSLRQGAVGWGMMGPARAHWCDTTRWANGRLTSGHNIKIKLKETVWIIGFCACLFRKLLGQVQKTKYVSYDIYIWYNTCTLFNGQGLAWETLQAMFQRKLSHGAMAGYCCHTGSDYKVRAMSHGWQAKCVMKLWRCENVLL